MKKYYLWGFQINGYLVFTRGETREQAQKWVTKDITDNVTIGILDHLPIFAAKLYTGNHPFDWLNKAPLWVEREEEKRKRAKINRKISIKDRKRLSTALKKALETIKNENFS